MVMQISVELCAIVFISHLCVFPDSSLSSENLSTVLDTMEDRLWYYFSQYVNIPDSESEKIKVEYSSDRERKHAIIPHLISTHPSLSWRLVANALYQMVVAGYGGVSSHRALDHLQQKFPTGNTYCKQYNTSAGDFPRGGGDVHTVNTTAMSPSPVSDFPRGGGGICNFNIVLGPESIF